MGTLVTLAHKKLTSEITHACTHVQLFIAGTFRQRKNFVKSDRQAVQKRPSRNSSGIYFRQTPVGSRLLCSRSIVALLIVVYFYIHGRTFLNPHFRFVKKLVRNLVPKVALTKATKINIQTKISCNKVHDEEEDEDDDDETIMKKGLKEPGL